MGEFKAPSQRALEKRYGDLKALIARRGEELGSDMSSRLARIDDPVRIGEHVSRYDGTGMGLITTSIRNIVNLYSIEVNGSPTEAHVIWMFEDLREFTKNKYRYNSAFKQPREFDRLYRETYQDRFPFRRLNSKVLEKIYGNPEVVPRMEEFLLGAYAKALEFYDWRLVPDGLVITGADNAMYTALRDAQTFGNDALGIGIGKNIFYEVLLYTNPKDYNKLETMFTALFVHELTHFHRMDNFEVSNFAISLLFDPKNNANLDMLRNDVDGWIRLQKRLPDRDALSHVNVYEIERYIGLVIAANQFAKTNEDIRRLFEKDRSPNKLRAARDFMKLIRNSDVEEAKRSGFVEELLNEDMHTLVEHIDIIDE